MIYHHEGFEGPKAKARDRNAWTVDKKSGVPLITCPNSRVIGICI